MALSVAAVSISVSPFFTEDEATDMFITSAPRRLPASSKEDWVRVEGSKNRLIWVRPRKADDFFSICRLKAMWSSASSSRHRSSHDMPLTVVFALAQTPLLMRYERDKDASPAK